MSDHLFRKSKKARKDSPFEPKGAAGLVCVLLHDVACILAVITFLFVFLARLVGVSGSSMYPTLVGGRNGTKESGDYLLLLSNFLDSDYEPGDIVVACVPKFENGKPIVKRVIAKGGQTIRFQYAEGTDPNTAPLRVYVDGVMLDEPYINLEKGVMGERGVGVNGYEAVVPEGCYFLMGDNRNDSTDSRYPSVGFVDRRFIVGKALWIVLPGKDLNKNGARNWSRIGDIYAD